MCFTYNDGMRHHRHRHRHGRGTRTRWLVGPGQWAVRARIERFVEPAVLLLLSEGPRHGLEEEGIVESEWSGDLPGPAKRTYRLTDEGRQVLERWVEALRASRNEISSFVDRFESGERR